MMYPGYMPDYMGWWMLGSYLFWALVIGLAVFLVVRLVRPATPQSNARAILDERLARGEIDAEEYRTRLAILKA
jgi:putative membrane protein